MCYHDQQFRQHKTFPFIIFGIIQCRQALMAACIQTSASAFKKDAHLFHTSLIASLTWAMKWKDTHKQDNEPAIHSLKNHIQVVSACVQGSDQSHTQLCSQIWSTAICEQPPSLWVTINPCDLHDPIVQVSICNEIKGIGNSEQSRTDLGWRADQLLHFLSPCWS